MKKTLLAGLAVFGLLVLATPASAQTPEFICDDGSVVGYSDECPDVVTPEDPGVAPTGALPRTGSDSSLPLAKAAIVLIGVGGALTFLARRKRVPNVTV